MSRKPAEVPIGERPTLPELASSPRVYTTLEEIDEALAAGHRLWLHAQSAATHCSGDAERVLRMLEAVRAAKVEGAL